MYRKCGGSMYCIKNYIYQPPLSGRADIRALDECRNKNNEADALVIGLAAASYFWGH